MQILWGKWQFNSGHFWASPKFSHNFNREGWRSMNREGHSLVVTALGVPWISLLNILSVIGHYFWQSCSIFLVACSISYLLVLFFSYCFLLLSWLPWVILTIFSPHLRPSCIFWSLVGPGSQRRTDLQERGWQQKQQRLGTPWYPLHGMLFLDGQNINGLV